MTSSLPQIRARFRSPSLDTVFEGIRLHLLSLSAHQETQHLMNAEAFAKLKTGVFLINVSRGGVVDSAALVEALERRNRGAALDVFEQEPLPPTTRC